MEASERGWRTLLEDTPGLVSQLSLQGRAVLLTQTFGDYWDSLP